MNIAACIAVYGKDDLTRNIIAQLHSEAPELQIYICDNLGTFRHDRPNVHVFPQPKNLGWLKGTNLVWRAAWNAPARHDAFLLLNNDVILSRGFLAGLQTSLSMSGRGIVGPLYDDVSRYQRTARPVDAKDFRGHAQDALAPYVDGTCMLVGRAACECLGMFDEDAFGFFGWGADIDYCIRARAAGLPVVVSHRSFLNHLGRVTATSLFPDYKPLALVDYRRGMIKKYGRFWGRHLANSPARQTWLALRSFATSIYPEFTNAT